MLEKTHHHHVREDKSVHDGEVIQSQEKGTGTGQSCMPIYYGTSYITKNMTEKLAGFTKWCGSV